MALDVNIKASFFYRFQRNLSLISIGTIVKADEGPHTSREASVNIPQLFDQLVCTTHVESICISIATRKYSIAFTTGSLQEWYIADSRSIVLNCLVEVLKLCLHSADYAHSHLVIQPS